MATIVYFHGFASVGSGPKVDALQAAFPNDTVIAPDLPITPSAVIYLVDSLLLNEVKDYPLLFIGTSLGGFWANFFAQRFDAHCIQVNPSVQPSKTMAARLGLDLKNYKTGEPISVTHDVVEQFKLCEQAIKEDYNGALVHLFLAKDDEIIPYQETLDAVPFFSTLKVFNDGGHRFEKHWDAVLLQAQKILKRVPNGIYFD